MPSATAAPNPGVTSAQLFAYVASSADGMISQYRLDLDSGGLSLIATTAAGEQVSPMALSPDRSTLFAALRGQSMKSVTFSVDPSSGQLTRLGEAALPANMAYLATDRSGQLLFGASYGGDLISIQRINADQSVQPEPLHTLRTGLHVHSVRTDLSNRFLYAGVMGADHLLQYRLDAAGAQLLPIAGGTVAAPPSSGPRHLAFSPNGRFLYVSGETDGSVTSYGIDATSGALTHIAHVVGIPARLDLAQGVVRDARNNDNKDDPTPRIWAADLKVTPDGQLLYLTERTSSSVSAFRLDPDSGGLTLLDNFAVQEKQPRNIAITPDGRWLLVTGELSEVFASYRVNPADGSITRTSEAPAGRNAVWIEL